MSIATLLNIAKAQNRGLIEMEGIIIYFETDSIPQEEYLIPIKLNYNENFESFVLHTLENLNTKAIDVYAQGMRWVMPNLLEEIQSMLYIKAEIVNPNFKRPIRISACKIYTDTTHSKELVLYPDKDMSFLVKLNEKIFKVGIENLKPQYGVPRYFEAMIKK